MIMSRRGSLQSNQPRTEEAVAMPGKNAAQIATAATPVQILTQQQQNMAVGGIGTTTTVLSMPLPQNGGPTMAMTAQTGQGQLQQVQPVTAEGSAATLPVNQGQPHATPGMIQAALVRG